MLTFSKGALELKEYYDNTPGYSALQAQMDDFRAWFAAHAELPLSARKATLQQRMAQECKLVLFPHYPFFWEMEVGRHRSSWGLWQHLGQVAQWYYGAVHEEYKQDVQERFGSLFHGWAPVGYDHHCPSYDLLLEVGLAGLAAQAQERLGTLRPDDALGQEHLRAMVAACEAAMHIAARFATLAEQMAAQTQDPTEKANLQRIAKAAGRVPAQPPADFHQALCSILFLREMIGNLDCFGVSTFGHLDRLLAPYYEADVAAGRLDYETAKGLVHEFLAFTDAKFGLSDTLWRETSTTVVLGGCDASGAPVCNAVTRMVLEACRENGYNGTKIITRISGHHPPEYYDMLAELAADGKNVFVMPNDDVLIPAQRRWNKQLADCRLYVGGGCHEVVLGGTEVCTRADSWVNLPGILEQTLFAEKAIAGMQNGCGAADFAGFYRICLENVQWLHNQVAATKTRYEKEWYLHDVAPLYSATVQDCIANARDVTAGGARYNSVCLSMCGAATFLDSLYVIRTLVFEQQRVSLDELLGILKHDFVGSEALHAEILHRLPHHGQANEAFDAFAAEVMRDLANCAGQPNGRGGVFTPAFYPHDIWRRFGEQTGATPDGRLAGTNLSRGFAPSEFVKVESLTDVVRALQAFDLTLYPESFATELTLPTTLGGQPVPALAALIRTFAQAGGSTLQLNVLDRETLLKAKAEPAAYPQLLVRICGYSQPFNSLSDAVKDEVIERAFRS